MMSENASSVSGLKGTVQFISSGPFAVGDPVFTIEEHIRIIEPAETTHFNGRPILYQRYHLCPTEQVPGYSGDSTTEDDKEAIERYIEELKEVVEEYPNNIDQLTGIDLDETSVLIHGELRKEYDGEDKAQVIPLDPSERRCISREVTEKILSE